MTSLKIAILGASGRTGQHLLTQALAQGHTVTAFVRAPERLKTGAGQVRVVAGDATRDADALSMAVRDQDVVISTIGAGDSFKSLDVIAKSMAHIIPAMENAEVRRFILNSAFGVGENSRHLPFLPRLFTGTLLKDIYRDKAAGEALLRSSKLDWTIVYPTGLTNATGTGKYRSGEVIDLRGFPTLARADLAAFLLSQAGNRDYIRKSVMISS